MRDAVAVAGSHPVHIVDLKKTLLLFDKVADFAPDARIEYFKRNDPRVSRELSQLQERGHLVQIPISVLKVAPPQYRPVRPALPRHLAAAFLFQGDLNALPTPGEGVAWDDICFQRSPQCSGCMAAPETVVTTTSEVAEALVKLQFSKLAKMLFSVRRRRADLLHSERTSPGAPVGCIVKAGNQFR